MRLFLAVNEACGDSVLCSAKRRGELDNRSVSDPTSGEGVKICGEVLPSCVQHGSGGSGTSRHQGGQSLVAIYSFDVYCLLFGFHY